MEYISHDIVRIWKTADGGRSLGDLVAILYRGDGLNVLERCEAATRVRLSDGREGWVRGVLRTTVKPVLAFAFIDVGQGDACLITTPCGHRLLVDGGENKLAARYLAARFREETAAGRDVHFDALVVTHGDADHFDGLSTLVLDAADETREGKHIRISARRVFHNGLVKRASSAPERELLGSPLNHQEVPHVVVVDDPRVVLDANRPFQRWQRALSELDARGLMTVAHLDSSSSDAFAFLHDVHVAVLGPRTVRLANGQLALPLLAASDSKSISAASTINGHSIVLRFTYGNVNVLLTGDVHAGMQAELRSRNVNLRAEVLKVPHHGSDDVDREFIEGVAPLVSVISAGDEDARRDYLHPRASLLAMLGKARRGADATTFVTNLAAFDRWAGEAFRAVRDGDAWKPDLEHGVFYARERTAYGIIHVRTDGKRLLAVRRGARNDRYEAYAYEVAEDADMGMDWIFSSNSRRWSEGTLIAKATHFVFIENYQAPRSTAGTERLAGRART